jgi:hypothetical protein
MKTKRRKERQIGQEEKSPEIGYKENVERK